MRFLAAVAATLTITVSVWAATAAANPIMKFGTQVCRRLPNGHDVKH